VFRVLDAFADGRSAVLLVDQPLPPVIGLARRDLVQRFVRPEELDQLGSGVGEVPLGVLGRVLSARDAGVDESAECRASARAAGGTAGSSLSGGGEKSCSAGSSRSRFSLSTNRGSLISSRPSDQ
jgi:hypothetical protein